MKKIVWILMAVLLAACSQSTAETKKLQAKIDSLEKEIAKGYKPGLGEFMSGIQTHHAKLWFAGLNQNWELADFEVHEIKEALEAIQQFCSDRPESKAVSQLYPAIDSVTNSITSHDPGLFKRSYEILTDGCNSCHKETEHAFNVVTIPSGLPVVNQDFKPIK